MAKIGLKNSNFVVEEDLTLEEAMRVITVNKKGSAIVLDKQNHVVGVVSDGDIRRAMQGLFTISDANSSYDSGTSIMKKVRVVTTVEYQLR